MGIQLRSTPHVLFFVVMLPALSFGVGWLFAQALPDVPFWVETISPLAAYGILYRLFEVYIWHWPIFRWLGIVNVPDMRGRWLGEQTSSYKDENGKPRKARVIMEVRQTFSDIHVETFYKNWQTEHSVASFVRVDSTFMLLVLFEAAPKVEYDGTATAHKGVMRLVQQTPGRLVGSYFNAAGRHGELTFRRTRYTLHRTFESLGDQSTST